jgi:hypothetical protein
VTPNEDVEEHSDGSAWFTPVQNPSTPGVSRPRASRPRASRDEQDCNVSTTSVSESGSTIAESECFDAGDWATIKTNILRSADSTPGLAHCVDDIIANLQEHAVGRKLFYPPKYVEIEGAENELMPMTAHDINSKIALCEACQRIEYEGAYCRKHSLALMCFGMEQTFDLTARVTDA